MERSTMPEANPAPPRYCPRCRAEGTGEGPLCAECGETLRLRGYCPTCEGYWKLDPGADCPKHDVELIDEAPPVEAFSPEERASLVTVATYSHPNQANAPRIRLEAEGIPTFLDGERIAGNTLYQVATGGVRLQVPATLASAARILIDQTWAVPLEADDDLDDAWDDLAPEPGAPASDGHERGDPPDPLRPGRRRVGLDDLEAPRRPALSMSLGSVHLEASA